MRNHARRKYRLFFIVNAIVILLTSVALATNPYADLGAGIYVMLLFLICTLPSFFIKTYRGKASLLLMFLVFYFATFALQDLANLIAYEPPPPRPSNALFTGGEIAILLGAISFMVGYALTAGFISKQNVGILTRDWSPKAIITIGLAGWGIGFYSNLIIQFGMGDQFSSTKVDFGVLTPFVALIRILGPLGTLMLIYSFLTTGKKAVLIVLVGTMLADFGLGFVGDSKETAMRAPLLFLFSYVIIRERLPVMTTVIFVVIAGLSFNFFAAYRDELGTRHETRSHALTKIDSKLDKIFEKNKSFGKSFSEGLDYFASRITLKQNVELIVARTGKDVKFQEGYTIQPLLLAFVPRFILPDKQDATQTGRIFNQEFHISGSRDTYIATSQLGELYWNFGWPGTITGMMCIGLILALIASMAMGDKKLNLPRFLLLLLTVYLLVLRSESGIAMTYTYWARAVVLLLLIHMLAPKSRIGVMMASTLSNMRKTVPKLGVTKRAQS